MGRKTEERNNTYQNGLQPMNVGNNNSSFNTTFDFIVGKHACFPNQLFKSPKFQCGGWRVSQNKAN